MSKILLQSNIDTVLQQVNHKSKTKLFSYTQKINTCDPILFYQGNQHLFKGKAFFWKSPDEDFCLVGLGAAHVVKTKNSMNRFNYMEQKWNELCEEAVIENPFDISGTGPLLFGGFSFDPKSTKDKVWESYGQSLFYLPKYMLTEVDGLFYITVNNYCTSDEACTTIEASKLFIDELLENAVAHPSKPASIVKKQELGTNEWVETVGDIVDALKQTSLQKVVLARKMRLEFSEHANIPFVLQQLVAQQPNSFIFALNAEKSCFLGASPERLVKKTGSEVLSTSLAGSIERSTDPQEDKRLEKLLLHDHKNLFEHQLVVSMIEDALRPYCNEINIPSMPKIMKTPDIQHLYTPVVGKMRSGNSILDIVEELHPTPALGGVPTTDAMEIIRNKEGMDRGFYAAPIGWFDYRDNGEFIVAIRSGLFQEEEAHLFAGCGLVYDSKPEDELIETRIKFRPMLRATGGKTV
ncbi:isochorismate synthase [Bacillus sp. FSL K6-3431]|uniref:isochorismate synthase n=1 Tax=Bacillus sp. FSL K6-3431 TaxID=2921500 RepID=UPI0030F63912